MKERETNMSKRFTDTEKWKDKWFRSLSSDAKILFLYCLDNCNLAGFIEIDNKLFSFMTGSEKINEAIEELKTGNIEINAGWIFIKNFLKHQKNLPLNPNNNCHKHIISLCLEQKSRFSVSAYLGANEGLISPIGTGTGKGKGKGKGKGTEAISAFESLYALYPRHEGKQGALKFFIKQYESTENKQALIDTMKKAIFNYSKKSEGEKIKFIMLASTFFNPENKRWEDYVNIQPIKLTQAQDDKLAAETLLEIERHKERLKKVDSDENIKAGLEAFKKIRGGK